ncbi:MAG: hypothetical protein HY682_02155 [Chloroflexi bacterium]|nr:hypothetical protein [Chloroflexota bacterium]
MSYPEEFATVDLIVASSAETRGVDAFALSLIKAERQIRRLVTHLIFQLPAFGPGDVAVLRETLADSRYVYFDGFVLGWDALYPRSVRELVGPDYDRLWARVVEAIDYRNKIFHGQLTKKNLSRQDLLAFVKDIRTWCAGLADNALAEVGYDGFGRNAFRKSALPEIWRRFKVAIDSVEDYKTFIREHMQRSNNQMRRLAPGQTEPRSRSGP